MLVEVIRKSDLFAGPVGVDVKIFTGARFRSFCLFVSASLRDGLQICFPFQSATLRTLCTLAAR